MTYMLWAIDNGPMANPNMWPLSFRNAVAIWMLKEIGTRMGKIIKLNNSRLIL
jgi:hypothetical protein